MTHACAHQFSPSTTSGPRLIASALNEHIAWYASGVDGGTLREIRNELHRDLFETCLNSSSKSSRRNPRGLARRSGSCTSGNEDGLSRVWRHAQYARTLHRIWYSDTDRWASQIPRHTTSRTELSRSLQRLYALSGLGYHVSDHWFVDHTGSFAHVFALPRATQHFFCCGHSR